MRIIGGSYQMVISDGSGHLPPDPIELMKLYLAEGKDPQELIREIRAAYGISIKDAKASLERALKDIFEATLKLKSDGALKPAIVNLLKQQGLHDETVDFAWKKILSARKIIARKTKAPARTLAASA